MAALEQAGLQLELGGFKRFLEGGQQVNKLIDSMASNAIKAATAFTKLESSMSGFGNLKQVENSAKAVSALGRTLRNFQSNVSLGDVNEVFKEFRKQIRLLANVDLKNLPEDLPRLATGLTLFSKALRTFTSGKNIDKLPTQLAAINKELPKLVKGITGVDGKEFLSFNVRAKNLATNLIGLAKAFREFTRGVSGDGISKAVSNAVKSLTGLDKVLSGFSTSGFTANLKPVTDALQAFAKVTASFGRVKGIKEFASLIREVGDGLEEFAKRDLKGLASEIKLIAGPIQDIVDAAKALRQAQRTASKGSLAFEAAQKRQVAANKAAAAATIQYRAALINLGTSLIRLTPLVVRFGSTLLKLPIRAVTASLRTLTTVFIKLPFKAVTGTFNLFVRAVTGSIGKLNGLINWAINVDRNLNRIKRGLSLLLTPFRPLIALINALTSAFARLIGQINIFNKSTKASQTSIKNQNDALKDTSKEAGRAEERVENLTVEVQQSGRAAGATATAFQTLAGVLVARGISTAIKRFISLQLTLRSLSVLSNIASNGFRQLSFQFQNLVQTGFTAAADFEGIALSINSAFAREEVQAGNFEDITVALEETRGVSEELLEKLRLLAIASPFNRSALADVFLAARNFGFAADTAEGLTQVMANLGAALNLNAADMREVVRALGQIKSGGASLQDLNQIGDRGIPIFETLAKRLNITRGELRELISARGVKTSDVFEAFADIGKTVEGQAALATDSLKGLLATFQDFRSDAIRNLFTPILDGLKPLASAFLSLGSIDSTIAQFKLFGETIAARVVPFVTNLVSNIEILQAIFAGIPAPVKSALFQVAKFAAILTTTSLAMGVLTSFMGVAVGVFFTFVNPLTILVGTIVALISSTGAFTTALGNLTNAAIETGKIILGLLEGTVTLEDAIAQIPNPIEFVIGKLRLMRDAFIRDFNTIISFVGRQATSLVNFFGVTIQNVTQWGSDLVSAFADGIIAAVGLVGDALQAIGDMLTFWLAPGSPPRIVPDIDTWGTQAADEFLGGFSRADFGLISDFGNTVDDLFQSLRIEGVDTSAIVQNFAGLLDEINTTGTFDEGGFNALVSSAGLAQNEVASLANQFLTLQLEQQKLNNLTGDYAQEIGNVSNQLSSLDDAASFEEEEQQLERLQQRLNNRFISDTERITLERQIARITAERRQREVEAEKRLAEQNVKNAQAEIDRTQERLRLAQDFAEESQQVLGGDTGSASGRIKKPKVKKPKKGKDDPLNIEGALDAAQARLAGFAFKAPNFEGITEGLSERFEETKKTVSDTFTSIQTRVNNIITNITDKFKEWGITTEGLRLSLVALGTVLGGAALIGSLSTLSILLTPAGALVAGVLALAGGFIALTVSSGGVSGAIESINNSFMALQEGFLLNSNLGASIGDILSVGDFTTLEGAAQALGAILGSIRFTIEENLILIKDTIVGIFSGAVSISDLLGGIFTFEEGSLISNISAAVTTIIGLIKDKFITPISDAFADNDTILTTLRDIYANIYGGIIQSVIDGVGDADIDLTGAVQNFFNNTGIGQFIEEEFSALFGGIDLSDSLTVFIQNFKDTFSQISTSAQELLQPILDIFSGESAGETGDLGFFGRLLRENQEAFSTFFEAITSDRFIDNVGKLATVLGVVLGGAISIVALLLDTVLIGVLKNFGDIFNNVIEGAENIILGFVAIFQGDFGAGITQVLGGIGQLFEGVFGGLSAIITDAVASILEFIGIDSEPLRPFLSILTEIVLFFASGGSSAIKFGANIIKGIVPAARLIIGNLRGVLDVIKLVISGFKSITNIREFGSILKGVGIIIKNTVVAGFTALINVLKIIGGPILNRIKGAFQALFAPIQAVTKPIATLANNILGFIPGGRLIVGVFSRITNAARTLGAVVVTAFRAFADFSLADFGTGLITTFIDGLTTGISLIGTFLSTTFSNIFSFWLEPASPPKFLPDIDTWGLDTALEFVLGFAAAPLTAILDFGSSIISSLVGVFTPESFSSIKDSIATAFEFGEDFLGEVTKPIQDAFAEIDVQESLTNLSDTFSGISESFGTTLPDPFGILSGTFQAISDTLGFIAENYDSIVSAFAIALNDPFGTLTAVFGVVSDAFALISDKYTSIGEQFRIAFPNPFGEALGIAADLVATAFDVIAAQFSVVAQLMAGGLENPFQAISQTIQPVIDFFATIDDSISSFIGRVEELRDNTVLNFVLGEPENSEEAAQKAAQNLADDIAESGVKVDASQLLQVDDTEVSDTGKKIAQDFSDGIGVGFTQAQRDRDKVIDLLNQGVTGEEIVQLGSDLGLDFNAGIIEGLSSEDNGTQEARDVAAAILKAAQAQLGIESPSTEARDFIGKPIIEGIIAGLTLDSTNANEVITATVEQIISIFESSFSTLAANSSGLLDSLFDLDPTIATKVTTVVTQVITQFRRLNTQQTALVTQVTKKTEDLTDDMVTESFKLIEAFVVDSLQQFRNLADNAAAEVKSMVTAIIEELERLAREGGALIEELVDKFEEEIERFIDLIEDDAKPAIQSLLDRLNKLQREGTSAIQSFVNSSKTALLELIEVFKQAGQDAVQGLIDAIVNAATTVATALTTLTTDVQNQLGVGTDSSFFLTRFEKSGQDIVKGLIKGMADSEDLLIAEARRLAQVVDNSFQTESGIFSPSRVFAENGKQLVMGLALGINENASIAALSVSNLALLLTATARTALGIQSPSRVAYTQIGAPFVDGITGALSDGHGSVSSAANNLARMMADNSLTQPIDVKYAGLLDNLPKLNQGVHVVRNGSLSGKIPMMDTIGKANKRSTTLNSNLIQAMTDSRVANTASTIDPIQAMTNSVNNATNTSNVVNNFNMSITTTERAAAKVTTNYKRMRLKQV